MNLNSIMSKALSVYDIRVHSIMWQISTQKRKNCDSSLLPNVKHIWILNTYDRKSRFSTAVFSLLYACQSQCQHYYLRLIRIHVSGIWTIFRATTSCGNSHAVLHANAGTPITMQIIGECIGSSKYMRCTSWMDEQCKYLQWIRTKMKAIANTYAQMIPKGFNIILHAVVRGCRFSWIETNRALCRAELLAWWRNKRVLRASFLLSPLQNIIRDSGSVRITRVKFLCWIIWNVCARCVRMHHAGLL